MTNTVAGLETVIAEIRVADAVAVVGAGASFLAGMPLGGQLSPLVWHTLDAHPAVRVAVSSELGVPDGGSKHILGDNWDRIRVAFRYIAADRSARQQFQYSFATLDRQRVANNSSAHAALARLVHSGRVLHVVSLNWDTLLEAAYRERYGIHINAQGTRLWKPHGDCNRPDGDWVLLHEPGYIPEELVDLMTALATERPRVLIIIGYSERDEVVVKRLITPQVNRWRVFRVSPTAVGEGAIHVTAHEALQAIADRLCPEPEVLAWEYVTFANQRGIAAAVSGERLGPGDVDACPRLPHFDTAKRDLDILHRVVIAGRPGCGKSITAWQLARTYQERGWEVLRPDPTWASAADGWVRSASHAPGKKVLVVDDAQTFPSRFAERLTEIASPDTKVILATTDSEGERTASVLIPAGAAVETLAAEFRRRRDEVLEVVRRYDPHVSDRYLDTPLERRIDEAAKAGTPWQFAFVLRGGWRQARAQLSVLRDFDRADLLLVVVAARQLLSLDAGSTLGDVVQDAQRLGKSKEWASSSLERLRRQKAILPAERLRCPHIQSAAVVIRSFFDNGRDPEFSAMVSVLRAIILDRQAPLRGIAWLLHELWLTDAFRFSNNETTAFLQVGQVEQLVRRCLDATDSVDRRDAAILLSTLVGWRAGGSRALVSHLGVLKRWLETVDGTNAYTLGNLVNNLYNEDNIAAGEMVESADPDLIATQLHTARPGDGYRWGYFLGRCYLAASENWRDRLRTAIDRERIRALMEEFRATELEHLSEFLQGVVCFDFDFAIECLKLALPVIERGFDESALESWWAIKDIRWVILGHSPFGDTKPSRVQMKLSRQIAEFLSADEVARGVVTCRLGDWERYAELLRWVRQVNHRKYREIIDLIDWAQLDERAAGLWHAPPRELRLLIAALAAEKDGNPARQWVATHASEIHELDPITAAVSPDAAVAVLRKGGKFNLAGHNRSDWNIQAWAIERVAELDESLAKTIITSNEQHISARLGKLEAIDCEELPVFLEVVEKLDPALLIRLLRSVDVEVAAVNWPGRLQEKRKDVRRGAKEVFASVLKHGEGGIRDLAARLSDNTPKRRAGKESKKKTHWKEHARQDKRNESEREINDRGTEKH